MIDDTNRINDLSIANRYGLFGGVDYYATGGFVDFIASFKSIESAVAIATTTVAWREFGEHMKYTDGQLLEWWHVFDFTVRRIVAQSEYQAYGWEQGREIIEGR